MPTLRSCAKSKVQHNKNQPQTINCVELGGMGENQNNLVCINASCLKWIMHEIMQKAFSWA